MHRGMFLNEVATTTPEVNKLPSITSDNSDVLLTPLEESNLLSGRQVLVVDDDIRNVYALANALEQYGMNVISAQNRVHVSI